MKDNILYLRHMLEAIEKVERYIGEKSFDDFIGDDMLYDAVLRELTIVGQAANRITDTMKQQYKDISWQKIRGLRNKLMHEYATIDDRTVWDTCQKDLPQLKEALNSLIKHEEQ